MSRLEPFQLITRENLRKYPLDQANNTPSISVSLLAPTREPSPFVLRSPSMLRITRCLVLLALVSFICGGLRAQQGQDLASLAGVVTDASGAVIPGVTVTLKNPLTGVVYTATTNTEGFYRIPGVAPAQTYC